MFSSRQCVNMNPDLNADQFGFIFTYWLDKKKRLLNLCLVHRRSPTYPPVQTALKSIRRIVTYFKHQDSSWSYGYLFYKKFSNLCNIYKFTFRIFWKMKFIPALLLPGIILHRKIWCMYGILLPKLFWPTVRKNCSSDREKLF